jgi:hypothetical protein
MKSQKPKKYVYRIVCFFVLYRNCGEQYLHLVIILQSIDDPYDIKPREKNRTHLGGA